MERCAAHRLDCEELVRSNARAMTTADKRDRTALVTAGSVNVSYRAQRAKTAPGRERQLTRRD